MECRTWSIAGDKRITGLCTMDMLRETAASMKNSCPICVTPSPVTGPKGCCVCDATEEFPGIWSFVTPFAATGSYYYADSEVVTGVPCLSRIHPPTPPGHAIATTILYRPASTEYTALDLIRVMATPVTPGCAWGNGSGRYDGWIHAPTYGEPTSTTCPIVVGYTEKRCTHSYSGPFYRHNGTSSVGGPFARNCIWPYTNFVWFNVAESPYEGHPFREYDWFHPTSCPYPYNNIIRRIYPQSVCWGWYLRCGTFHRTDLNYMLLTLTTTGYSHTSYNRVIAIDGTFGAVWVHNAFKHGCGVGSNASGVGGGEVTWKAIYPCNNPATITLTTTTPSPTTGMFKGLTFPTTIILEAVY